MADKLDGGAIVANTIPGTKIQSGTITTTQLSSEVANVINTPLHPKISSITYPGNDTAANTGGGDSIVINGSGFGTNVQVYINGTAAPSVTRNNANAVTITTAAQSAGTYLVYLINTDDGGTAILVPGIQYSGTPTWVTESPLTGQDAAVAWSISLSATGDSPIVYTLQAGSSLPDGITLAANGLISGTMTSPPAEDTTYNFTVVATDPQSQDTPKAFSVSVTVVVDPQFQYTTLLLQADGTNNGNNHAFLDSSNNNYTITRNGNATQGSFTPFSPTGWSNYFDGTGDYLNIAENAAFQFGTGDFTIEAWIYRASSGRRDDLISHYINASDSGWVLYVNSSNKLSWGEWTSSPITGTSDVPSGIWTHVAACRSGSTLRTFINGIQDGSATVTRNYTNNTNGLSIGSTKPTYSSDPEFLGYMSNMRIIKGTALYASNFTPSTLSLAAITNTSILTCQSNRLRDASNNNFAITRNGDVSVQAFSPFAASSAYSPATHGGSAYFDGTGDYLSTNATQAIPSTGDFTIEAWVYPTVSGPGRNIVSQGTTGSSGRLQLNLHTDNTLQLGITSTLVYSTGTVTPFAWNYVAVTRTGSSVTFYINGVNAGTATLSGSVQNTALWIGSEWSGDPYRWLGYISSVRISNNIRSISAVTSPFSSDANTVFLANFTNAQIYDAAAGAVLETVGDAKVNTAIKKYGAGSIAFDGTGDYLTPAPNQNFAFRTGDFTVEYWIYTNSSADDGIFQLSTTAGGFATSYTNGMMMAVVSGVLYYALGGSSISTSFTINNSTWYHIAMCRTSGVVKIFVNGTQVASAANTTDVTATNLVIGGYYSTSYTLVGYIDDFRISNGLARYRYPFTPPTRAFSTKGGTPTAPTEDEYFDYTTLLLPGNGTNNQNNHTFLDSSNNNFTITRNGNATQGTFSPFSQTGWSNYFDGSGDNLTAASNAAFSPGTGDFTYESWIYPLNWSGTTSTIFVVTNTGGLWIGKNSSNFVVRAYGVADQLQTTLFPAVNQWTHVAVARSGTTLSLYYNGTRIVTTTNSYNFAQAGLCIGDDGGASAPFAGYISNSRLVKGTAVYDPTQATITVPTSKLTAITNTSILTCSTNRFLDESTNNFALTRNGDVSVQAFSPFNPTASYAAANVGGSLYLDGSGDYITVPTGSVNNIGTNGYTIEGWFYPLSFSTDTLYRRFWSFGSGINDSLALHIDDGSIAAAGRIVLRFNDTIRITSNTSAILNAWNHIATVRNGATTSLYLNGALVGTHSNNDNLNTAGGSSLGVGVQAGGSTGAFSGYISSFRIAKNTATYTTTFTPPTAPLTNVANTSLLLNFTNAGITDATAKNVLETVGDAKISTAQSKFGGSSMYFDGTGDYLLGQSGVIAPIRTGDFTVECWARLPNVTPASCWRALISIGDGHLTSGGFTLYAPRSDSPVNTAVVIINTVNPTLGGTSNVNNDQWNHIAVTRYNGILRIFVNGIQENSTSNSADITQTKVVIGRDINCGTTYYQGFINDARITVGIARYTQNFTPPTTAFLTK